MIIVRYADDIVAGFEHEADARRFWDAMRTRFEQFSLELHGEKTRLLEFGRYAIERRQRNGQGKPQTFNFLGFTFICGRSRRGAFLLRRHTRRDRMRAALKELKDEMRRRRHDSLADQGRWLRSPPLNNRFDFQIMNDKTTHFGFQQVAESEKASKVRSVFSSVAGSYDVMNDLMSFGLHRLWKAFTVQLAGVRKGDKVLDVAGGTADLSLAFARKVGPTGQVWLTDINHAMLSVGRDRVVDKGFLLPVAQCDAEKLPFPDNHFDVVTVAFGLRNMTHKDVAIAEMHRVLKPGGRLLVLEFSKVWKPLAQAYDFYSFKLLPMMGEKVAKDADSYRYLAESIRMHPDQESLKDLMQTAGLARVEYFNMTAGVVALHRGYKL